MTVEVAILHECKRCNLVFDSPCICCGQETTPFPQRVPSRWARENIPEPPPDAD